MNVPQEISVPEWFSKRCSKTEKTHRSQIQHFNLSLNLNLGPTDQINQINTQCVTFHILEKSEVIWQAERPEVKHTLYEVVLLRIFWSQNCHQKSRWRSWVQGSFEFGFGLGIGWSQVYHEKSRLLRQTEGSRVCVFESNVSRNVEICEVN